MIYLNIITTVCHSNSPDNNNLEIQLKGDETQQHIQNTVNSYNSLDWFLTYDSCIDEFKSLKELKEYYEL